MILDECEHPYYIRDKFYNEWITCPCGKCPSCLKRRRSEWCLRLNMEARYKPYVFFTLTYRDDNLPIDGNGNPCFSVRHIQLFLKRLRKKGYKFRYFIVSEYGSEFCRPHYHGILFNQVCSARLEEDIRSCWDHGFISISEGNPRRIGYCCKYLLFKSDVPQEWQRPIMLCSRNPALGSSYFDQQIIDYINRRSVDFNLYFDGRMYAIPRTFRKKYIDTYSDYRYRAKNRIHSRERADKRHDLEQDFIEKLEKFDGLVHPIEQYHDYLNYKLTKSKNKNLL